MFCLAAVTPPTLNWEQIAVETHLRRSVPSRIELVVKCPILHFLIFKVRSAKTFKNSQAPDVFSASCCRKLNSQVMFSSLQIPLCLSFLQARKNFSPIAILPLPPALGTSPMSNPLVLLIRTHHPFCRAIFKSPLNFLFILHK